MARMYFINLKFCWWVQRISSDYKLCWFLVFLISDLDSSFFNEIMHVLENKDKKRLYHLYRTLIILFTSYRYKYWALLQWGPELLIFRKDKKKIINIDRLFESLASSYKKLCMSISQLLSIPKSFILSGPHFLKEGKIRKVKLYHFFLQHHY
jgi:hypothetical protein